MPSTWPQELLKRALQNFTELPWLWLWEIVADRTVVSTPTFYLVRHPFEVSFGGNTYKPFPITLGQVRQTKESDLVQVDLVASNATRTLAYYLEQGQGFLNMPVTGHLVNMEFLAQGAATSFEFVVGGSAVSSQAVTLTLETPNFFQRPSPQHSFTRDRCRHLYKGRFCGYKGALTDCNRTYARCVEIGDDERLNGLPVRHPLNFGAFPGIPRRLQ